MFDPMKQILSIYEASRNTYTIAYLDDFETPQCEAIGHDEHADHHSGSAGFWFITPCKHGDGYVCAPFAEWLLALPRCFCRGCHKSFAPSELTFIPIGIS